MKSIKHRDPEVKNRDPEPATPVIQKHNGLPCVSEQAATCPQCKSTTSEINATRPELAKGFILKYRTCKSCGKKYVSRQNVAPIEQWPAVDGVDA